MKKKERKTKLNPQQEAFCQYYVCNSETFGNGVRSYSAAYDYDISPEYDEEGNEIHPNVRYDMAAASATQILKNIKVQERLTKLYNEMLRDEIVDRELAKVVLQDEDKGSKIRAINEFNKLRQRILDKSETSNPELVEALKEFKQSFKEMINGPTKTSTHRPNRVG